MEAKTPDAKQHAHELLEQLGPGQLAAVVHLLEALVSPDEDGDTLSAAERQAIAEADAWLKHNHPIPHAEVLAEFGLTEADWEKMGQEPLPGEMPRRNG
ncbi:MAG TPA: hypothetical protein VK335_17995 [Bryobacteraceae bacterium]|nr:hypothetical protein [Bryobacteraceae bacterium]